MLVKTPCRTLSIDMMEFDEAGGYTRLRHIEEEDEHGFVYANDDDGLMNSISEAYTWRDSGSNRTVVIREVFNAAPEGAETGCIDSATTPIRIGSLVRVRMIQDGYYFDDDDRVVVFVSIIEPDPYGFAVRYRNRHIKFNGAHSRCWDIDVL